MSFDPEMSDLAALFLEEAEEQLQKLDDGILQLENDPANLEILKEIFRAAHTVKGSSATMGYTHIANLTHAMENLLDPLRSGAREATPEIIDLLLGSVDALRRLVSHVSAGETSAADEADIEDLLSGLHAACENKPSKSKTPRGGRKTSRAGQIPAGAIALKLKITDECMMPSVRAFMIYHALSGLGEIVSSEPHQDKLDDIQAGQRIAIVFTPTGDADSVIGAIKSLAEVELLDCTAPEYAGGENEPQPGQAAEATGERVSKSIQTVRVGVDRLDTLMNLVAELVIDRTRLSQIESNLALKYESEELIDNLGETAVHVGRVVTELQEHIMKVRLLPVEQVFNRFPRMVRDLAHRAGKEIDFVLEGQETELDRSILEDIVDPLTHLLRNAVDHGVETSDERAAAGKPRKARIVLAARQEENKIVIEVSDDGAGIALNKVKEAAVRKGAISQEILSLMSDEDALQLVFASGVSTAEKVTEVSGRGVGMDVVRNNIQSLSGTVEVYTEPGVGTRFKIGLPLTLAIIQALVVGVGDRVFVIPLSTVVETFQCKSREVHSIDSRPAINFRGSVLPLVSLRELFEVPRDTNRAESDAITFVVVNVGALRIGLAVDRLIGDQEVVIKPLGSFFGNLQGIAGATILGDGRVALILDVAGLGGLVNRRRFKRESIGVLEA